MQILVWLITHINFVYWYVAPSQSVPKNDGEEEWEVKDIILWKADWSTHNNIVVLWGCVGMPVTHINY